MRRYLVAGNWKMHGSRERVARLLGELKAEFAEESLLDLAVIPPFVYIDQAKEMLAGSPIAVGAQNVFEEPVEGAFTGEVGADMLVDIGCRYVIVGHSERRALFGETDRVVATKAATAIAAGLTPIVCIGETERQRDADETLAVVERQLHAVLDHVGVAAFQGGVIAYEPVWAIGTGRTATPVQAQKVHGHIRSLLGARSVALAKGTRLLYGGSVKSASAQDLFAQPDIDGGLVGGASLDASEFSAICRAAI